MHLSTAPLSPPLPSTVSPQVRDAADTDLPAIQAIYAHHVLHGLASFEEVPPGVDELRTRLATVRAAGLPYLVAEIDGAVAGYAYATLYRPRSAYRHTVEDSVYVAQGMAGRGIGAALLSAVIARCEAGPWRQMMATIGQGDGNRGSISPCTRAWASRASVRCAPWASSTGSGSIRC